MAHGTGDGSAWMGNHAAQQADDEVSDSGEHLGAMAFAHLGSVLVESDVAHPMQAVLDAVFREAGLNIGAWGLPVAWRDDDRWQADLAALPGLAALGRELGCTRTATWCLSGS